MTIEDVYRFVKLMEFLTPRQRRDFFKNATKSQVAVVEEACLDLIKNLVALSEDHLGTGAKHMKKIKRLSD